MDADTGQIIAADLTGKDVDDGSQVDPLLEQIAGPVAPFTGIAAAVNEIRPFAALRADGRGPLECRIVRRKSVHRKTGRDA